MKMPLFYYPSTLLWVDDSPIFIKSIQENCNAFEPFKIKTLSTPDECLEYLKSYQTMSMHKNFLSICEDYMESDLIDHIPADINFDKIRAALDSDQINDEISVMIVDQNMPGMSGIELCNALIDLPIKKILLTGSITDKEVINAFNTGKIDCYIRKNSENFLDEIKIQTKLLTEKYLSEKSSTLLTHLETKHNLHFSDPTFMEFFYNWCELNSVSRYHVIDKFGNMRVINNKDEISNFVIFSDETINEFISLNIVDEPNRHMETIISKERLPFFGEGKNGWEFDADTWDKHLYPCNRIDGKNKYYWFTVKSN